MSNFQEFAEQCRDQGVVLHKDIENAAINVYNEQVHFYYPDEVHAAVAMVGRMLSSSVMQERLADKKIQTLEQTNPPNPDIFIRNVLASLINASIEPSSGQPGRTFENNNHNRVGVCRSTEVNFARIFAQMQNPREPVVSGSDQAEGYQIITGSEGEPIAVRKAYGLPSTLALADISINRAPYPRGSIMALSLRSDADSTLEENSDLVPAGKHRRVDHSMVSAARFMRVSAFALPPASRRPVFPGCFVNLDTQPEQARQFLESKPMDDIVEVARTAAWEAIELR